MCVAVVKSNKRQNSYSSGFRESAVRPALGNDRSRAEYNICLSWHSRYQTHLADECCSSGLAIIQWPCSSLLDVLAVKIWYWKGVNSGSFCRKATIAQIRRSSCVFPHAGMPEALIPCLITQNLCSGLAWSSPWSSREMVKLGGTGYSPRLRSLSNLPGFKWQPAHISL